jgi:hypothetical protein
MNQFTKGYDLIVQTHANTAYESAVTLPIFIDHRDELIDCLNMTSRELLWDDEMTEEEIRDTFLDEIAGLISHLEENDL